MQLSRLASLIGMLVALCTIAMKFYAYKITSSVGMLSDAIESCLNLSTAAMTYWVLRVSHTPEDEGHPYGHEKAEYFSSAITGLLIVVTSFCIMYAGIQRLFRPQAIDAQWEGVLWGVGVGALNLILALWMRQIARSQDSIALAAESAHLMSDIWTTAAVVLGFLGMLAFPHLHFLDGLIASIIGLHVLYSGVCLIKSSVDGLMDAALPAPEIKIIQESIIVQLPSNIEYNSLRTRKSGNKRFIEFKLLFPGQQMLSEAYGLSSHIKSKILHHYPNSEVNIYLQPR